MSHLDHSSSKHEQAISELWTSIARNVHLRIKLSRWVILSGIATVQVPGLVEKEWLPSKLTFIENDKHNRLREQHLNACLTLGTQRMWEFKHFPFQKAMLVGCKAAAPSWAIIIIIIIISSSPSPPLLLMMITT
eukprot:1156869-Pelagomonas_calceolata.AAC.3